MLISTIFENAFEFCFVQNTNIIIDFQMNLDNN